jgi:hypothetical protein
MSSKTSLLGFCVNLLRLENPKSPLWLLDIGLSSAALLKLAIGEFSGEKTGSNGVVGEIASGVEGDCESSEIDFTKERLLELEYTEDAGSVESL